MENPKPVKTEFYFCGGKNSLYVCVLFLLFPVGLYGINSADNLLDKAGAWFLLFLGAVIAPWYAHILLKFGDSKPVLIVSKEGIMDHRTMKGIIPWSIITGFRSKQKSARYVKAKFIELEVSDEKLVRSMFKTVRKYTSWGTAAGTITVNGLDGALEEIEAAIEAMRPQQN